MPDHTPPRPRPLVLLAAAAGFAAAHTQAPLFYSNQNQYLLHGLAAGGYGHLNHDWLANTADPTPVLSWGVAAAYRVAGLWPLQAGYFALLMAYFLCVRWLVAPRYAASGVALFAAVFTAAHAAVFRLLSVWLTGTDYPWFMQAGVAAQYVLGPGLQPSAFGVLLVASLAAFAGGRPYLAAVLGAGAAVFHATYLLPAALFTLGYMTALLREGQTRTAVGVGAVSLAVALPVVAYTLVTFPPSSPEAFAEAQHILADVRIPHHASVARWFDAVAALQVAWAAVGIVLVRRTRLFLPLLVAAVGAVALTLVQVAADSDTLALLFPWRVSVVLVPVATAVVVAEVVRLRDITSTLSLTTSATGKRDWVFGALLAVQAAGGVAVMALGLGYAMNDAEEPLLEWVRTHAGPGDVYLIPTRIPPVDRGRGAMSSSFVPPRPPTDANTIPVDLQRFRLATGTPIYADFKSIPYRDAEVLEWYRRVRQVEAWYANPDWDAAGVRGQLRAAGVTHVVVPRHAAIRASFLEDVWHDAAYTVYRVK